MTVRSGQQPGGAAQARPSHLPLQGVRILAVEQFGASPYGTMFLGQMGATVIKIENPASAGDPARRTGPFFLGENDSEYFQTWNSNKKSIVLDIRSQEGRRAFELLAADADVVVNNLRGDLPQRLALDYAALRHINRALVCVHISAYGRDNERASWPGYDYLMQAESGLMHLTGEPDGPPVRLGAPSIVDHMTGITSMVGLLAALLRARETGEGCDVDTCLFDVALHQLGYAATWLLNEDHCPQRQPRSGHYSLAPVQTFPTADGWLFIMCMTQKFWLALLRVVEREDLADSVEFDTPESRYENRRALSDILDADFRKHPTDYWLSRLQGVLPVAPVRDLRETLNSEFVQQSGMITTVAHPAKEDLRLLSSPLKFDGQRPTMYSCPPMGGDTDVVLGTLAESERLP